MSGPRRQLLERYGLPPATQPPDRPLDPSPRRPEAPHDGPRAPCCLSLIATRNYLPHASITARSFAAHHPDIPIYLLIIDGETPDRSIFPLGTVVLLEDMDVPGAGWASTKYDGGEFANAMKPAFLLYLSQFAAAVIYLDCDIAVFAPFTGMLDALKEHDAVLIPHMLMPYPRPDRFWVHPNNADIFNAGLINAGCFALRLDPNQAFLRFWLSVNLAPGTFYGPAGGQTDQQYLNWALVLLDRIFILRDTAYNVAYWNLHDRQFQRLMDEDGSVQLEVDRRPLVCFHFSGYDPNDPLKLSKHDHRYSVYTLPAVAYLLSWYSEQLARDPMADCSTLPYRFDRLANGFLLSPLIRGLLKKYEASIPPHDGMTMAGADQICAFLMSPLPTTGSMLPLIAVEIYDRRPDIAKTWPDARDGTDSHAFWRWFCYHGGVEWQIDDLVTGFRRVLTSDALVEVAEEVADLMRTHGRSYRFLGKDRRAAESWLRGLGRGDLVDSLLETEVEWSFFDAFGAVLQIYERRDDLREAFPNPFTESHRAFATWLRDHSGSEHDVPERAVAQFETHSAAAVLARIFSYLSRREDLGQLAAEELLSDEPKALIGSLIRGAGEGLEYDLADVAVLSLLHLQERHLLVPLYLELPVNRRLPINSRAAEHALALLPEAARETAWAQRGLAEHARAFSTIEIALEDEVREQYEAASAPSRHVFDVLRNVTQGRAPAAIIPAYRRALRRTGLSSADLPFPRNERETPVNVFGYFLADIGVGESVRGLALSVERLRPVRRIPLCTGHVRQGTKLDAFFHHYDHMADVNIFSSYPHSDEDFFGLLPAAYFRHRRNIIHLAWEQQEWNHHWRPIYERYDEIWAISEFAAEPFRRLFGGDVRVVPNILDVESYPACTAECAVRLTRDVFVFLFVFDSNSSIERKNPEAVIEAFIAAFKDTPSAASVRLWLKVGSLHRNEHAGRVQAMQRRAAQSGLDITFDGRDLPRHELMHLIAGADCYVSLHRAEGFGYSMAEAMYYGVPVIASGYSGNLEYMDEESAFLVPCSEEFVQIADGPFQRGSTWGKPDHDAAVGFMRQVFADRETARDVGARGRDSVLNLLTADAAARRMRPSLLTDATPAARPPSARADKPVLGSVEDC
ncbi:MAG TPA: glycosyltransferase family 4 protein [Rhodopila sp.]|uniref:glycosyltransferase family 4 protein n=1 Tax=Rhodopila sp. TaxID=2480087 RepID=UPI002CBE0F40|nr:glycosyltransferase family 4 protein [Rhodopila sp.]HVY17828.1 glycosyltransferase family 4 protein [Rhodopila sp.]